MTTAILDIENWSGQGVVAEVKHKQLIVRLGLELTGAPVVKALGNSTRTTSHGMVPVRLAFEYTKTGDGPWEITVVRAYGYRADNPEEKEVNIYPHETMSNKVIPAWIRDAAYRGMPDFKQEDK